MPECADVHVAHALRADGGTAFYRPGPYDRLAGASQGGSIVGLDVPRAVRIVCDDPSTTGGTPERVVKLTLVVDRKLGAAELSVVHLRYAA